MARPRLVGMNHIALEVGDVDEALAFYGQIFDLTLRGRVPGMGMAFVDMGDQFIALALVVDDKAATRRALEQANAEILPGRGLDFRDPWGNHLQVVQYDEIQFTKADHVLRGMGLELGKTEQAAAELRERGLA